VHNLTYTQKLPAAAYGWYRCRVPRPDATLHGSHQAYFTAAAQLRLTNVLSSLPVLGMKVKPVVSIIWLLLKINQNLSTTIPMKRSPRELFVDMVILIGILKNNEMTLFPCFTYSYLKQALVFPVTPRPQ